MMCSAGGRSVAEDVVDIAVEVEENLERPPRTEQKVFSDPAAATVVEGIEGGAAAVDYGWDRIDRWAVNPCNIVRIVFGRRGGSALPERFPDRH